MAQHRLPVPGAVKTITSLTNDRVKEIRSLTLAKNRRESGLFLAEGLKLVTDAQSRDWRMRYLVTGASLARQESVEKAAAKAHAGGAEVLWVSEAVLAKISRRDNPQTVIGVFEQRLAKANEIAPLAGAVWVALEGIKNPGNLGTILRTVDAVGANGVLLIGECVDPFSLEAVRATMGSIFHVPLVRMTSAEFLAWRKSWTGLVVGTHLRAATDYRKIPYDRPCVLLMGNEQSGLSPTLAEACDELAIIPMKGQADSLNLAIATGVMLFEMRRNFLGAAGNV